MTAEYATAPTRSTYEARAYTTVHERVALPDLVWAAKQRSMGVVTPAEPLAAVVARLLGSIVVGCGLVTLGAKAVATTPKFSLTEEQFDQSTFAGLQCFQMIQRGHS